MTRVEKKIEHWHGFLADLAWCWPAPEVAENVNTAELDNLGLTPVEEDAIVAFMETLSDGYFQPETNWMCEYKPKLP